MKKAVLFIFVFALLSFGFQSCDKDDDPKPITTVIVNEVDNIDASAYDKWIYISFKEAKTVGTSEVDETRSGLDWDIAFHRWDIRLNCGNSGSGKGGAILSAGNIAKTGWDALTTAPALSNSTMRSGSLVHLRYTCSALPS